jgi:hypothetical protein
MSVVAAGVGTIATAVGGARTSLSQKIEMAMVRAVQNALDEGISVNNTEELLRRKQMARATVLENEQ